MGLNEKDLSPIDKHQQEAAPGLELTTVLPEVTTVNSEGVPSYLGLTGTKLIAAITLVSFLSSPQLDFKLT